MRKWVWAVGVAVGVLAAGQLTGGGTGTQADRGWPAFDGREWVRYAPAEKRAYVAGFLAGAALADAERAGAADSAAIRATVDSLFRGGDLRFPFGQTVYATQLDEFYWWENHVPTRLYLALRDVNRRLKRLEQ